MAGWDTDKAMKFLKKALPQKITMAIRDRLYSVILDCRVIRFSLKLKLDLVKV